jgi:hypothetical protein
MMINSRYFPLRSLTIRTFTMSEGKHRRWREDKRLQRAHSDQVVELIRNYCNPTKNSNCTTEIITVRGVVTVAARLFSMEEASSMDRLVDGTWPHINSRGIGMRVTTARGEGSQIIMGL